MKLYILERWEDEIELIKLFALTMTIICALSGAWGLVLYAFLSAIGA